MMANMIMSNLILLIKMLNLRLKKDSRFSQIDMSTWPGSILSFVYLSMIIATTPNIEGKQVTQVLGIARGNTVRSRNAARDIFAALKNVVGGEIDEYTKLQAQAREQAISRMKDDAKSLGADAVINVRITTSMIMQGCSEIMAYGTAVKLS